MIAAAFASLGIMAYLARLARSKRRFRILDFLMGSIALVVALVASLGI